MLDSLKSAIKTGIGRISAVISPSKYGYVEDLVSFVNTEFERRRTERWPYELQWRLNLAFLDGNQYLDIHTGLMDLIEIQKLYWWQEREVFNHIAPTIETRIARFARMQPKLKVRPATCESADISSAKVSTRLLDYTLHERLTAEKRQALFQWMEACGSSFLKNIWDPKLGKKIGETIINLETGEKPESTKPVEEQFNFNDELEAAGKLTSDELDKNLNTVEAQDEDTLVLEEADITVGFSKVPLYEGDVNPLVVPAFEIYPDSCQNPTIEDCRSIIHAKAYPIEEIYDIWGVRVDPESIDTFANLISIQGSGGLGYGFAGFGTAVGRLENHALVKEYWERPTLRYPKGRLIVVANNKLLHVGTLPFNVGPDGEPDLPFVKIDCINRPGCFFGRSIIERLIPVQRRYNAVRNRKAEYLNRCAIGQLCVQEGSVDLDDEELNGASPGYIHVYKKGFNPPHYIENPSLPAEFTREEAALLNEFTLISGVSEIARHSMAPPGVKSGVALDTAIQQDDTRLSHTVNNYETGLVKAGKQWLRLYRQKATQPRLLRTVGTDLEIELIQWDAGDIRSDDVIVETGSFAAESPAQRRQMVFDLLAAGLFIDPDTGKITKEGQRKIFELLQFGDWEFWDDEDRLQVARAERENRAMSEGTLLQPSDIDDDVIHIQRHNRYRLSAEFDELNAKTGGQIEQLFKAHTMMHLEKLQQAAMQQMLTQARMQAQLRSPAEKAHP